MRHATLASWLLCFGHCPKYLPGTQARTAGCNVRTAGPSFASGFDVKENVARRFKRTVRVDPGDRSEDWIMINLLWAVAAILLVMWLLGFALNFTLGGLVHVLLIMAIISVLVRIIMGRRIA
jgi:hypothetical protein